MSASYDSFLTSTLRPSRNFCLARDEKAAAICSRVRSPAVKTKPRDAANAMFEQMFAFFSNRLGCLGSLAVSVIGTIVLLFLIRGCSPHW